jgi:hypothetical protein
MLDYTSVTRELRSVISRRREMLTFLGSVFAALGLFLNNSLGGGLPSSLASLKGHIFAAYAFLLMVPSLLIALRLARLNMGMTLNGMLYARLMMTQDFIPKATTSSIVAAGRVNPFGVSFLMFLLSDVIAAFSAALLAMAVTATVRLDEAANPWKPWVAVAIGLLVLVAGLVMYMQFHRSAVAHAQRRIDAEGCAPFERNEWEEHVAGSLEDGNHDMIAILGLCGLIVFSVFESLSGLGQPEVVGTELSRAMVEDYGPVFYSLLMVVTCVFSMVTYLRLRVAIGTRSLEIDPSDQPFRPLKLTDSLIGYMLLSFFFAVGIHFLLESTFFREEAHWPTLLTIDAVAFALAVLAEQLTLVYFGRIIKPR